jgi:hypothetical protein
MHQLILATWALLAVCLFGGAAILHLRRQWFSLRGKRLPLMRVF